MPEKIRVWLPCMHALWCTEFLYKSGTLQDFVCRDGNILVIKASWTKVVGMHWTVSTHCCTPVCLEWMIPRHTDLVFDVYEVCSGFDGALNAKNKTQM